PMDADVLGPPICVHRRSNLPLFFRVIRGRLLEILSGIERGFFLVMGCGRVRRSWQGSVVNQIFFSRLLARLLLCLATGTAEWAESRGASGIASPAPPAFRAETVAPRCSLTNDAGVWWLLSPEGDRFFSMGVCCVHPGTPESRFDPENPGYAAW